MALHIPTAERSELTWRDIEATATMLAEYLEWEGDMKAENFPGDRAFVHERSIISTGTRHAMRTVIATEWVFTINGTRLRLHEVLVNPHRKREEEVMRTVEITTEHDTVLMLHPFAPSLRRGRGVPATRAVHALSHEAHVEQVIVPPDGKFIVHPSDTFIATSDPMTHRKTEQHLAARKSLIDLCDQATSLRMCLKAIARLYTIDTVRDQTSVPDQLRKIYATQLEELASLGLLTKDTYYLTYLGRQLLFDIEQTEFTTRRPRPDLGDEAPAARAPVLPLSR